ncbi:MAG TPA: hypothetical protein VFN61_04640 [Acidimicrobiales bacterium]|nr:hypothetical protein [Acidimicrobiales bacterium]
MSVAWTVAGALIVLSVGAHIVRTLVVPRARRTILTTLIDGIVDQFFQLLVRPVRSYERRDSVLAAQAAAVLIAQLVSWLGAFEVGFALVLEPQVHSLGSALEEAASSMFTLGFVYSRSTGPTVVDVLAAATGMVVVALQIAYLPTLYSAFNRRETEVTLLGARAGTPPWGPELLLRTRYGVTPRTDSLPQFFDLWERWAADVAESHSNYPVLVRFRSPQPLSSWLVGLLAVMDAAAMYLSLCPSQERMEARLALRMGFTALREVARALGAKVDEDPEPDGPLQLSYEEFASAVEQLVVYGFPVERTSEEAWPHFRGWRVNYEALAYDLARRTDAVPAPWSGPRRWKAETIAVRRPPNRQPGPPATSEGRSAGDPTRGPQ